MITRNETAEELPVYSGAPPVSSAAPFTPDTLAEAIELYARRPSVATGRASMAPRTLANIRSVLNGVWYKPALLSGKVGDELVVAVLRSSENAPKTYRTGYFKKVLLPFLEWCGKITAWEAAQWRKKVPYAKPERRAVDRIPTPQELALLFNYARLLSNNGGYAEMRNYLYLATLYVTGVRATQPMYLRYPDDVLVTSDSVAYLFKRLKSPNAMKQRITVPFSVRLPNGDQYGTVFDRYCSMLDHDAVYFFYPEGKPEQMYSRPDLLMRMAYYEPLGLQMSNHSMRALLASNVASVYGTYVAQQLLGHQSVLTTQGYVKGGHVDNSAALIEAHTNMMYYNGGHDEK